MRHKEHRKNYVSSMFLFVLAIALLLGKCGDEATIRRIGGYLGIQYVNPARHRPDYGAA